MDVDGINPYASPQAEEVRPGTGKMSSCARGFVRALVMGLTGFGSFGAVGLLYFVCAELFQLEIFPSLPWVLGVGVIGGLLFASSELFKSCGGTAPAFIWRILAAMGAFVTSGVASAILIEFLGWQQRAYFEDPYWRHKLILEVTIYFIVLVGVRALWMVFAEQGTHGGHETDNQT